MQLAFHRRGAGPPLILVHPLGADRRVWDPVMDRLSAEREVVAVDLPGFGESPVLGGAHAPTPAALAGTVAALAGQLSLDKPHVAGNSLGGWVALELALAGHARSVTAIAPAGMWRQPLMPRHGLARTVARAALPAAPALVRAAAGRRLALGSTTGYAERVPADAALRLVRGYATALGFDAVDDAMRAGCFTGMERLRVPVTLVWPELDRLVSRPAHLPATVRNVVLPGCGHVPMWDDPEAVAKVLLAGSSR